MASMDIFNQNAFKMQTLTNVVTSIDYQPTLIRSMNLTIPKRVRTEAISIESKDGVLNVIQTSDRGAPLDQRTTEKRVLRNFNTSRISKGDRINAGEIQSVRAYGSETELQQVQSIVAERLNGPAGLMREVEMTWENQQLGMIQGIVLDADSSVIYNWYTEFGVTQPTELDFDLDNASPASGAVEKQCQAVQRAMKVAAKGAWVSGRTSIVGLAGDAFWDDLKAHPEIRNTYLQQQQANQLRENFGDSYGVFNYGGIEWINYRGTDDGSAIAIGTDKVKFFPKNAPGMFVAGYSPGEWFDAVNTPGKDVYSMIVPDRSRNMFVDVEVYSYPLFVATRPLMLQSGRRT